MRLGGWPCICKVLDCVCCISVTFCCGSLVRGFCCCCLLCDCWDFCTVVFLCSETLRCLPLHDLVVDLDGLPLLLELDLQDAWLLGHLLGLGFPALRAVKWPFGMAVVAFFIKCGATHMRGCVYPQLLHVTWVLADCTCKEDGVAEASGDRC